jgi:hypothetical protein
MKLSNAKVLPGDKNIGGNNNITAAPITAASTVQGLIFSSVKDKEPSRLTEGKPLGKTVKVKEIAEENHLEAVEVLLGDKNGEKKKKRYRRYKGQLKLKNIKEEDPLEVKTTSNTKKTNETHHE